MSTRQTKASVHADHAESGVQAAVASLANGAEKLGELSDALKDKVRGFGHHIADGTRDLADRANKQAHLHPLAVFGIAFAAGVVLARALRR